MISHHHINNYFRQSLSIDSNFDWLIVHYFGQTIDNDKNWVIAITFLVGKQW